jgi:hypothetical protein
VAELFEEAFRIYRRSFSPMVVVFGAFMIPLILVNLPLTVWQAHWSQAQWENRNVVLLTSDNWLEQMQAQLVPYLLAILLAVVAALLIGTFAAAGITLLATASRNGHPLDAGATFKAIRVLAPKLVGLAILLAAGWLATTITLGAAALGIAHVMGATSIVAIALLLLIGLLFMVLIFFAATRLVLAIPALVMEGLEPIGALRRSWNLVSGSTWRVLGIFVLVLLVVTTLGGFLPMLLPGVYAGLIRGSVSSYLQVAIVGGAVQVVLGPIVPTLMTALYFDLGARPA